MNKENQAKGETLVRWDTVKGKDISSSLFHPKKNLPKLTLMKIVQGDLLKYDFPIEYSRL